MIRSMTGKSSIRFSTSKFDVEMEIRSVNSRYFEFKIKAPPRYMCLEIDARKLVSQKLSRGKIDLLIRVSEKEEMLPGSLINKSLVKAYLEESYELAQELGIADTLSLREVLSFPQVLKSESGDIGEDVVNLFLEKLTLLIDGMIPMMLEEGKSTVVDIENSLQQIEKSLFFIKERYPQVLTKYKNALRDRVLEITEMKAPEDRLTMELEFFASRTAINEEIIRLESHINLMKNILSGTRKEGSKELDFIGQEMNREVNTIASKSSDFEITEQTIILKSEVEKMREQFRNIV